MSLDKDRQMVVQEMEGASRILKTMIYRVLTKYLTKNKVMAWLVLHMLFLEQKQCHVELC